MRSKSLFSSLLVCALILPPAVLQAMQPSVRDGYFYASRIWKRRNRCSKTASDMTPKAARFRAGPLWGILRVLWIEVS